MAEMPLDVGSRFGSDPHKGPVQRAGGGAANTFKAQAAGAKTVFNKTRVAISRASDGEQVPSVSWSLFVDVQLVTGADRSAEQAGNLTRFDCGYANSNKASPPKDSIVLVQRHGRTCAR
jgi:hypothetical protein